MEKSRPTEALGLLKLPHSLLTARGFLKGVTLFTELGTAEEARRGPTKFTDEENKVQGRACVQRGQRQAPEGGRTGPTFYVIRPPIPPHAPGDRTSLGAVREPC